MIFLEIAIVIIVLSMISLGIASHLHHRRVELYIKKELIIEDEIICVYKTVENTAGEAVQ